MTFQEWLQTEAGRMVSFEKMPHMLEIVWNASAEAAEARVKELEHDLEVDDWHAAFVKAEAERDNERKEREALYPVIDGKNRAIKSLSTDVLKMQRINGELLTERDEARRQLSEAQHAIDVLSNTVVAQDATIKRLEQEREDVADYRAEIARLNQAATA